MKRFILVFAFCASVVPRLHAQTSADSAAVIRAAILHYAQSETTPATVGVIPQTFTVSVDTGFRWSAERPGVLTTVVSASSRLRAAPSFDSLPKKCQAVVGRGQEFCGYLRDYDAVVSTSKASFDGNKATLRVRINQNSPVGARVRVGMAMYSYELALRGGSWIVTAVKLLGQS